MSAGERARRKSGGEPGNTNALKHGFYARHFTSQEIRDLEAYLATGLGDEIVMMRIAIRRVMELAETESLEEAVKALRSMGAAASRLAGLLKVQKELGGDVDQVSAALSEVFADVLKDLRGGSSQ
jgi:hypothetical protein